MSRRTPIEELVDEESAVDTPSRRRSSRIAAVVTRRASITDDAPTPVAKSKRLSLSQEASIGSDDSKAPSTPQKKRFTRSASKSPSALTKIEEVKNVPAVRTRRTASTSSIMDEESKKEERAASPVLSKITTRRRSLRSQSTSPTSESVGNSKVSTPRKSTRAVSASPTNDLTKSAPPKLKGRRPSVTEKIIPLEAIEETEPKAEEPSTTKEETLEPSPNSEEKTQSIGDENLPFKKKKSSTLKKQNLQSIVEKISEESDISFIDEPKGHEKDPETIIGESDESSVNNESIKKVSPMKSLGSDVVLENLGIDGKKAASETTELESKPRTPKHSLSLKTKNSPGESVEEKELKAVLSVEEAKLEVAHTPRRSPRLSHSDSGHNDKTKLNTSSVVNITAGSEESFNLKLNLSQFDSSQENEQQQQNEEKAQQNGLNISGSSNTSDKENQTKPSEIITKKLVVLADNLNIEKVNSALVEKLLTTEPSDKGQRQSQGRKSSFYEPMDVDEFPSDYEYSILEKGDANDKTPTKKLVLSDESPKSPIISSKVFNVSVTNELSAMGDTSEKAKLVEASSEEQNSKTAIHNEALSPSVEIKFSKDHLISTELAKPISPKRRSARLLNQSKSDSPEENEKNLANSTPKLKSARNIDEDLENSMEIGLNETTVLVDEQDLENVQLQLRPTDSKNNELGTVEDVNTSKQEKSNSNKSLNLNTSAIEKEDQNKLLNAENEKNDSKNVSTGKVTEIEDQEMDEIEDDSKDDDPKFSEESDSEGSKKDLSKRESFSKSKSKTEEESEEQTTSSKDEEEINFSLDSDSEENTKDGSKDTSPVKRMSLDKDNSTQQKKFLGKNINSDDLEKYQHRRDSLKRKSKDGNMEQRKSISDQKHESKDCKESESSKNTSKRESPLKRRSLSNKKVEEAKFSEDSSSEEDKNNKSKENSSLKRMSISNNIDEEAKFSEDSDDENTSVNNQSKNLSGRKSISDKKNESKDCKESGSGGNTSKTETPLKRRSLSNKNVEEVKFSEDSSSEDDKNNKSKEDSSLKRMSTSTKTDKEAKFSEDSDDENTSVNNRSTTERIYKNLSGRNLISNDVTEEISCLEDDSDDNRAPFILYTIKSKKSVNSKPITPKDKKKSLNKSKGDEGTVHLPSILIDSESDTENVSNLDTKIQSLIANQDEEDDSSSNSSYQSVTHYLDDMAEEGEEDTPSEGSNDIIDRGESIGSTESEIDSDDTYQNDSFIDDSGDDDLLSGEEYDLGQEEKLKQPKKKLTRVITVSDSEEENDVPITNERCDVTQPKIAQSKEKVVNGVEEDSDLEKMSTQPYCGLTPPSIISLRESLSDNDKIGSKEEATAGVLINKEDNLQSLEELKQHEILTTALKTSVEERKSVLPLTPKADQVVHTIFTPNNSILEDQSAESSKSARKRQSSITIHENIKLQDVAEGSVGDRISKVVDVFCSSVKQDGKERCGNISLNISLEYLKSPSQSEQNSEIDPEERQLINEAECNIKTNLEKLKRKSKKEEHENEKGAVGKAGEKVLMKRRSSELYLEKIKLSAEKQKPKSKSLSQEFVATDEANAGAGEGWETLPEDNANEDLVSKKKSKKGRKNKKPIKRVELVKKTKTEKEEIIPSDSDMSEDLDAELFKKYGPTTFNELVEEEEETVPNPNSKKLKKKSEKKRQVHVDNSNTINEFVKKDKKRKRDKTNLLEEPQENKTILKTRKHKQKLFSMEPNICSEPDPTSDEVFLEESQHIKKKKKRDKKSRTEEIKPKEVVAAEMSRTKKKKLKPDQPRPSSSKSLEEHESKFQYFPSRILNTLTATKDTVSSKKPKLVPSSTMGKRSWDAYVVDEIVLPSTTSSKKFKMDPESFNKKDYKNLMLFDPSRVKRMDSKNLLKKKQKMKF